MLMRIAALIVATVYLCACSTLVPLGSSPDAAGYAVESGDRVVLATRDGGMHDFTVTHAGPEEICGKDECVRAADITGAQRQVPKPAHVTTAVAVGLVIGLGLVLYLLAHVPPIPAGAI